MYNTSDVVSILVWCLSFFAVGVIFYPFTSVIFNKFHDKGYLFGKVIGVSITSYALFLISLLHILPFGLISIILILWVCAIANFAYFRKKIKLKDIPIKLIVFEELLFIAGVFVWAFVRAHEPSINGLEKFMDFGFINSILRSTYMPPTDMWFPPYPINYYYFGHFVTAVMTLLSMLPSYVSFNLMIATLFSFCFSLSFSIGINITSVKFTKKVFLTGILIAALITFAGNLHTIYAFFKAYNVDHPVPFWNLQFLFSSFPNSYWYPNATRFIPFTIHEFPIYSFVVSDLHGHVLDIMFVLTTIAVIFAFLKEEKVNKYLIVLISFLTAVMYMTNVWDGLIYMLLTFIILAIKNIHFLSLKNKISFNNLKIGKIQTFISETAKLAIIVFALFLVFSLPFNLVFKPFASGIGILCAPDFLTRIGKIGPFLFEANHCQKSTWWELLTLYGFFYFFVISFFIFLKTRKKIKIEPGDIFVTALIVVSTILIIVPEFIYVKDIYPAHYRANTMFKLVYQAFMMLSISSGYIISRILGIKKNILFLVPTALLLGLVFIYPYFAVKAYYNDLQNYAGLDGIKYLKTRYPEDYSAINFINGNILGRPVMVEAQGDSYTDYERISANTGLPTILGWTVHEWLWRGTYDVPAPRIAEVKSIYESPDISLTKNLLKKYDAKYVYIGGLEHQKYPALDEEKFSILGKVVFQEGQTRIYKLNI